MVMEMEIQMEYNDSRSNMMHPLNNFLAHLHDSIQIPPKFDSVLLLSGSKTMLITSLEVGGDQDAAPYFQSHPLKAESDYTDENLSDPPAPVPALETVNSPPTVSPFPALQIHRRPLQPAGCFPEAVGGFSYQDWAKLIIPVCSAAILAFTVVTFDFPGILPLIVQVGMVLISLVLALFLVSLCISSEFPSTAQFLSQLGAFLGATILFIFVTIPLSRTMAYIVWAIYAISLVTIAVFRIYSRLRSVENLDRTHVC